MSDRCFDYDYMFITFKRGVVARKSHRCSECGGDIKPGEKYTRASGPHDGTFSTFKSCPRCEFRRDLIDSLYSEACPGSSTPPYGMLDEAWWEGKAALVHSGLIPETEEPHE